MEEKIIVNIEEAIRNMFKDYFTSKVSNVNVSNGKLQVQRYDDSDFDDNTLFVDDCTETDISLKYNVSGGIIAEYAEYQEFNAIECIPVVDGGLELKDFTISSDVDWIMTFDLLYTNREAFGGMGIDSQLDIFSISDVGDGVHCNINSIYEWNSFKIIKNNSTYSVFVNDNLVGSVVNTSIGSLNFDILSVGFTDVSYYIKDIKIKKFNIQEYDITTGDENKFKLIGKTWGDSVYWYQSDNLNYIELRNPQIAVSTANTWITTSMGYYNSSFVPNYPIYHSEIFNSTTYGQNLRFNSDGTIQVRSPTTGTRTFQGVLTYPRKDKIISGE